jgi:hypothetical protein
MDGSWMDHGWICMYVHGWMDGWMDLNESDMACLSCFASDVLLQF